MAALGALAVVVAQGFTAVFDDLSHNARTLLAAVLVGILGGLLAHRARAPAAIWTVPGSCHYSPHRRHCCPYSPKPKQHGTRCRGRALKTAFAIGVGVASGSIIVATYQRYRDRVFEPVIDVSSRLFRTVGDTRKPQARPWHRKAPRDGGHDAEHA